MKVNKKNFTTVVSSSLIISLLALAGCEKAGTPAVPDTSAAQPASTAAPYTPPTADELLQMVAPIALFPDKLVAQVLAGATYPDQIVAANQWLAQNPALKGDALQAEANRQPWDVSVKSLTAFPSVLAQMANNIGWTQALGKAYVNDPNDVMNAIQTMRLRAQQSGNLKTSQHLKVSATPRSSQPTRYVDLPDEPLVYNGPAMIAPPPQLIEIESAQPDMIYVPTYNPAVVYGRPLPVYPGYAYQAPGYSTGAVVTTGAISFGVGILVGAMISNHDGWGWHSWGMNWGGPVAGSGGPSDWRRPAVVYNNATYISKSTTVINQVNNNVRNNIHNNTNNSVNNTQITNNNNRSTNNVANVVNRNQNVTNNGAAPALAARPPQQNAPMTMPHFTANDARPGARPPVTTPNLHNGTNGMNGGNGANVAHAGPNMEAPHVAGHPASVARAAEPQVRPEHGPQQGKPTPEAARLSSAEYVRAALGNGKPAAEQHAMANHEFRPSSQPQADHGNIRPGNPNGAAPNREAARPEQKPTPPPPPQNRPAPQAHPQAQPQAQHVEHKPAPAPRPAPAKESKPHENNAEHKDKHNG